MNSNDWRNEAECRSGYDAELWFPIGNTGPALLQIEEAKAVCRNRCPVMERCLQWALEAGTDADSGVWGGLSEY
jgi:WhiB family redox-sensing transcriptional regulator